MPKMGKKKKITDPKSEEIRKLDKLEGIGEETLEPATPNVEVTFASEKHFQQHVHRVLGDILERLGSIEEHLGSQKE